MKKVIVGFLLAMLIIVFTAQNPLKISGIDVFNSAFIIDRSDSSVIFNGKISQPLLVDYFHNLNFTSGYPDTLGYIRKDSVNVEVLAGVFNKREDVLHGYVSDVSNTVDQYITIQYELDVKIPFVQVDSIAFEYQTGAATKVRVSAFEKSTTDTYTLLDSTVSQTSSGTFTGDSITSLSALIQWDKFIIEIRFLTKYGQDCYVRKVKVYYK